MERDAELERLAVAIGRVESGDGAFVLVEGAAGIGKSRLLAAGRERADDAGVRVLRARGGEFERGSLIGRDS